MGGEWEEEKEERGKREKEERGVRERGKGGKRVRGEIERVHEKKSIKEIVNRQFEKNG